MPDREEFPGMNSFAPQAALHGPLQLPPTNFIPGSCQYSQKRNCVLQTQTSLLFLVSILYLEHISLAPSLSLFEGVILLVCQIFNQMAFAMADS